MKYKLQKCAKHFKDCDHLGYSWQKLDQVKRRRFDEISELNNITAIISVQVQCTVINKTKTNRLEVAITNSRQASG